MGNGALRTPQHADVGGHAERVNIRTWLATLMTIVLVAVGISVPAGVANAAEPEVTITVDNKQVESGKSYELKLGYADVTEGYVATIMPPQGITIPEEALNFDPVKNTAIKSMVKNENGSVTITFTDQARSQGYFVFNFSVDTVTKSEVRKTEWLINGKSQPWEATFLKPGDKKDLVTNDSLAKTANNANDPGITVVDGKVVVPEKVATEEYKYTITIKSKDAREVVLSDVLESGMELVGSLAGSKKVTDEFGYNGVVTTLTDLPAISGQNFEYTFNAEAFSTYTFTYKAKVTDIAELQKALQAKYDAVKETEGAEFKVEYKNTAQVNGKDPKEATRTFKGNVPTSAKPGYRNAFAKSSNVGSVTGVFNEENTDITQPIPVTYTLKADLRTWADFADTKYALAQNVVISDTLPDNITWDAQTEGWIASTGIELTPVTGVSAADFAQDQYAGKYQVDGQSLLINVGKNVTTNATITLKATIQNLKGITGNATNDPLTDMDYRLRNTAFFKYGPNDGDNVSHYADHTVKRPRDTSDGVIDPSKFKKERDGEAKIDATTGVVNVKYKFVVNMNKDATGSQIIDYVDHKIFNVTEETLPQIKESISGAYDYNYGLDGSTFDVSLNEDGYLVIEPNASFPKQASWGADADKPLTKSYSFTITLPTHPIQGKQTLTINNTASYQGEDSDLVYREEDVTTVTSYGDEMEIQKRIYDAKTDSYTSNLRVEIDDDGNLVEDEFVYRVDLIPHGDFTSMVRAIEDLLPANVSFVGFVNEQDMSNPALPTVPTGQQYKSVDGKVAAAFDEATNKVTLAKSTLGKGQTSTVYFKVKVNEFTRDVGITNVISNSDAVITPSDDYPLKISKVNSKDETQKINGGSFEVLDAEGKVVIENAYAVDGLLKVKKDDKDTSLTVKEPGTYTVVEKVAPVGYKKTDQTYTVTVGEDGKSNDLKIYNDPAEVPTQTGTFSVSKVAQVIDGDQAANEKATEALKDVTFTVVAKWGEKSEKTFTLTAGGEAVALGEDLPVGTEVTFSEVQPSETVNVEYQWQSAVLMVGNTQLTDSKLTISEGDKPVELTVVNNYKLDVPDPISHTGAVSLSKTVAGVDEGTDVADKSFDFTWTALPAEGDELTEEQSSGVLSVLGNGEPFTLLDGNNEPLQFPVGTQVSFTETTAATIDGHTLDASVPVFADGATVTVAENETVNISAVNTYTKNEEPIDPTYAIGDVVWVDTHKDVDSTRNGDQNNDQVNGKIIFLEGVKVTLLDGNGDPYPGVEPTYTNENGRYIFDNLPAGEYFVKFELTEKQAKIYKFTTQNKPGIDPKDDSDADEVTGITKKIVLNDDNIQLVTDPETYAATGGIPFEANRGIDPTWDAGVVMLTPEPLEPTNPTDPSVDPTPDNSGTPVPSTSQTPKTGKKALPVTGGTAALIGTIAGGLLLLGAGAVWMRRRKS